VAHSSVSLEDQARIYERTSKGTRKIVLSTNICETSVTGNLPAILFSRLHVLNFHFAVPDVTAVIDSGRAKHVQFNARRALREFNDVFADTSSLRQRQGRAGRVREGICFKLYSSSAYSTFPAHAVPELRRCPLSGLMLQMFAPERLFLFRCCCSSCSNLSRRCDMHVRNIHSSVDTLRATIEPPPEHIIAASLQELSSLGAIREDGTTHSCLARYRRALSQSVCRYPHRHRNCFMFHSCRTSSRFITFERILSWLPWPASHLCSCHRVPDNLCRRL
jgi:ATP-dependent RNA helicase DHX57